ncbi:MAG: BrnT family toxin [Deltaproteobacteria bacterium]|nr:BrnT family toxin [Deltaproteobacteria bacterium]
MKFVWDTGKAKANWRKHKIAFEEATTVFYDPLAKIMDDPDHSDSENRFILIGHSQKRNLLFVVHVYTKEENIIRIISARKATKRERRAFEEVS